MLVSKMVQIEFADPGIQAVDAVQDIRKAAESASFNLYARYDVQLQMPMVMARRVVVELKVPDVIAGTFAVGNHLRGIASYLLKRCDGRYDRYVSGKRLLHYTEIPAPNTQYGSLPVVDRLEAVAAFAALLQRSDVEAMDAISRILILLREASTP